MKVLNLKSENKTPCVIALGYFDGVHLGHRAVIEKAVSEAKALGALSAVFTFTEAREKHRGKAQLGEIYTPEYRLELFSQIGVDFVIMPEFSEFCGLSPIEFVDTLIGKFNTVLVCCGNDFRFGKNAAGTVQTLKNLCSERSVKCCVLDEVKLGDVSVSSTEIRNLLKSGEIEKANAMLKSPYSIYSEVVSGKHLGRERLYPTINQSFDEKSLVPKFGVYASKVMFDGKVMPAVTNIGICPTFEGQKLPTAETHILDADVVLYGKKVCTQLISFLREEKKFDSIDKLKKQISADIEAVRNLF